MANLLDLPHEVLLIIFGLLRYPQNFSMTCSSLNSFARDPLVIAHWILGNIHPGSFMFDIGQLQERLFCMVPVLDRLVCFPLFNHPFK